MQPHKSASQNTNEPRTSVRADHPRSAPAKRITPLLLFFLRLIVFYILLIVPWPGVRDGYGACFRAVGQALFGSFGADGKVTFKRNAESHEADVLMVLGNRRMPRMEGKATCDSRLRGYFPTAFLVALVLATPIPWKRRGIALLWGLLLVNIFVAGRIALLLFDAYSGDHAGALFHLSPFWTRVLQELDANLVQAPVSHFVVPLFIWIIVAVRRRDLERWIPALRQTEAPARFKKEGPHAPGGKSSRNP